MLTSSIPAIEISTFPYTVSPDQIKKQWTVTEGEMHLNQNLLWLMGSAYMDFDLSALSAPVLQISVKEMENSGSYFYTVLDSVEVEVLTTGALTGGRGCEMVPFTAFLPAKKIRLRMREVYNLGSIKIFDARAKIENYDWNNSVLLEEDWWLTEACGFISSEAYHVSGGMVTSPKLDFSGMKNPELRLSCSRYHEQHGESLEIAASVDGINFRKVGQISGYEADQLIFCPLSTDTRFVRIMCSNWNKTEHLLLRSICIVEGDSEGDSGGSEGLGGIISTFPFITSFEPGQEIAWRYGKYSEIEQHVLHDGDFSLSLQAGDTLFSPEFDLSDLKKPVFSLYSIANGKINYFPGEVLWSADGVIFDTITERDGSNSYLLPTDTRFIALVCHNSIIKMDYLLIGESNRMVVWGPQEDLTSFMNTYPYSGLVWKNENGLWELKQAAETIPLKLGETAQLHLPRYGRSEGKLIIEVEGLIDSEIELSYGNVYNRYTDNISLVNGINEINTSSGFGSIIAKVLRSGASPLAIKIKRISTETPLQTFPLIQHAYDADGDGILEFFTRRSLRWDGELIEYSRLEAGIMVKHSSYPIAGSRISTSDTGFRIDDLNRDGLVDFISDDFGICTGSWTEFTQKDLGINLGYSWSYTACDLNGDGIKDVLIDNGPDLRSNEPQMIIQRPDGAFVMEQIRVFTPEMLSDTLKEFQNNGGRGVLAFDAASVLNGFKNNWCIPSSSGSVTVDPFNPLYLSSADFNKDGLMDVIGSKGLYSNLTGNRVLHQQMDARYIARDLNNDFITDFICVYNSSVSILLYDVQKGTFEREELVSDMVLDQRLYCYDFDADGDIDILLPFSNTTPGSYAFLVFAENDGTGRFTNNMRVLHENVYDKQWKFLDCADIDNDGYYDMIVAESVTKISVLKGKSGFTFAEMPQQIPDAALQNTDGVLEIPALQLAYLGDFNRDGKYELLTHTNRVYAIPGATVNRRPEKPAVPTAVYDAQSGVLRVNWKAGKDAESSASELSYALRIGTTPQGGEILAGEALVDGTRRNLLDGNMGYNLDRTFFTDSWGEGTFYIALQSIDPNRNGSAWSEPCTVRIERPRPLMRADKQTMSTGDTLSLYTLMPSRGSLVWSYPGATLVSSSPDQSQISLTWSKEGEKMIRLSHVIGTDSLHSEYNVTLYPARFVEQTLPYGQLDIDQDGDLDQLSSQNGVSLNDGIWNLTRVPMLYNQNLTFGSYPQFIDFNFDGLPDILDATSKGNILLNQGSGSFRIVKNNTPAGQLWYGKFRYFNYLDFDNDGKSDYFDEGREIGFYDITRVFFNEGDYEQFTKLIPGNQLYSPIDWNKDGLWDLYFASSYGGLSICLNNGDRTFTQKEYTIEQSLGCITAVVDLNNDGYFDLITENGVVLENLRNETFEERFRIRMPANFDGTAIMVRGIADIDNNGYDDLLIYGGILHFYKDWAYAYVYVYNDWPVNFYPNAFYDRTGNGLPDLEGIRHISGISNTPPTAPTGLRALQQEGCIKLNWEDAFDQETPVKRMRYNVSLKKKGSMGANSFILSPLNGLKDAASIIPQHRYYESTSLSVPLRVLPEGVYELQVQAIDAWYTHSPMSEALTFSVLAAPALRLEEKICARYATTITYTGNIGTGVMPQWDWDGGELIEQSGQDYRVIWMTAGTKNVVCRLGDQEICMPVYVKEPVADELEFPAHGFVNSETAMLLPASCLNPDIHITWYYRRQGATTYYPLTVERRGFTREARVRFRDKGLYDIKAVVDNGMCEPTEWLREIEIHDVLPAPQIATVSVDATSGKYHVSWDERLWNKGKPLPTFVDEVIVFRQGTSLNDFREIARVPIAQRGYLDMNSYPEMETSTYRLALSTTFGIAGSPGSSHTPAVLMLNKLEGGVWNISWTPYQGANIDNYRILRGNTPEELTEVGRVAGNYSSWIDRDVPQDACYYALIYERYVDDWIEMRKASYRAATAVAQLQIEGKSLVCSTAKGNELNLATHLFIRSGEDRDALTPESSTLALFADIQPVMASYKIVRWHVSQGGDIATVDQNGVVRATGAGNGEVRIQATTIDGSGLSTEKVLTIRDYSECLAPEIPTLEFGGDCFWTSYDADLTYAWYVDEIFVSQGKGMYKFDLQPGPHSYRVVVSNDCGLSSTSETVSYELTGFEQTIEERLIVGPNPVRDNLYVHSENMSVERVVVIDRQGRMIYEMKPDNTSNFVLSMSAFEDGMYFIHFIGRQQITRKIIKIAK